MTLFIGRLNKEVSSLNDFQAQENRKAWVGGFLWRGEWSIWRHFLFSREFWREGGLLWIYGESLFSVGEVGLCQRLRILSASDDQRLEFGRGIVLKKDC